MPTLKVGLTDEERREADKFFARLSPADSANIGGILTVIGDVAKQYLTSDDVDKIEVLCGEGGTVRLPVPFFTTFVIGGQITKEGDRPDVDLLLATNMRYWSEGELHQYAPDRDTVVKDPTQIRERLLAPLLASVRGKFTPTVKGPVPYSYQLGRIKDKFMVRFNPTELNSGKPIDFVYVNTGHTTFVDEAEFLKLDVDEEGRPLSRLPIQRLRLDDYVPFSRRQDII